MVFKDINLNSAGRLRGNQNAPSNSFLKIAECNNGCEKPVCQDKIIIEDAEGKLLSSISIDGIDITFDPPVLATDSYALTSAIEEQLTAPPKEEICVALAVCQEGDDVAIFHIGDRSINSITPSDGDAILAERSCKLVMVCHYEGFAPSGQEDLLITINGNSYTLDSTDAMTLEATLILAFLAAGVEIQGISIEVNANGSFKPVVLAYGEFEADINGKKLNCCGCEQEFDYRSPDSNKILNSRAINLKKQSKINAEAKAKRK